LESDGSLLPLDESAATPPSITRTWFVSGLKTLYRRIRGDRNGEEESAEESSVDETDGTESGAETSLKKGRLEGRGPAEKAGGRRRKAVRRR